MAESSDSEDNEKFKEAIDNNLFNNEMFTNNKAEKIAKKSSNRHSIAEESQRADVNISSDMRRRIGEKLSSIIGNIVKFVDVEEEKPRKKKRNSAIEGGVRLLADSENCLDAEASYVDDYTQGPRRKIKKRKVKDDCDDLAEADRVRMCAVTPDYVASKVDTKHWKSRKREKIEHY